MAMVYVHFKSSSDAEWTNVEREFSRIPCVGEFVALGVTEEWLRVYTVVHCPFEGPFYAEVYVKQVAYEERYGAINNQPVL